MRKNRKYMKRMTVYTLRSLLTLTLALHTTSFSQTEVSGSELSGRGDRSSIILVGDLQSTGFWERALFGEQNDSARQAVLDKIAVEDPAFLIILGDIVSTGGNESRWEYFEKCARPIRERHIPIYAVPGNHEYFGGEEKGLKNFYRHIPLMENTTRRAIRYKNIACILLNSNFKKMSRSEMDEQNTWYVRTLNEYQKDSSVASIIVCCHHPPMTNSTIVSGNDDVRRDFVGPFLKTSKARLFFSGHCHSYERFVEGGKTFIVTGGGGGARQKVIAESVRQRHRDQFIGPEIRPFHFCRMTIEETTLRVSMVCLDSTLRGWTVADEITVEMAGELRIAD